jgi:hypothetical protein
MSDEAQAPKVEATPTEQTPTEKLAAVAESLKVATKLDEVLTPAPPEEPAFAPLPDRIKPPAEPGEASAAKNQPHTKAMPFKHPLLSAADKLAHKVFEAAHGVVIDTGNTFREGAYRFKGVCTKCGWQTHVADPIDGQNIVGQHSRRHGNKYVPVAKPSTPAPTAQQVVPQVENSQTTTINK